MPPLVAVAITPGHFVVVLGRLSVQQRRQLAAELRGLIQAPEGAPPAGHGGASTSDGVSQGWLAIGTMFLALAGLAGIAFWRRRDSS